MHLIFLDKLKRKGFCKSNLKPRGGVVIFKTSWSYYENTKIFKV